jgi:hypothetical protein
MSIECLYKEGGWLTQAAAGCTGIKCTMVETERQGHARDVVLALSLAELQSYDGIVAVRSPPSSHVPSSP